MDWKRGKVAFAANRSCLKPLSEFERPAATSADPEDEITAQLILRCGKRNANYLLKLATDFFQNLT